jgi:hypothetical protein
MVSRFEPRQNDLAAVVVARVDLHRARENHVHRIAEIAFAKDHGSGRGVCLAGTSDQGVDPCRVKPAEKTAAAK